MIFLWLAIVLQLRKCLGHLLTIWVSGPALKKLPGEFKTANTPGSISGSVLRTRPPLQSNRVSEPIVAPRLPTMSLSLHKSVSLTVQNHTEAELARKASIVVPAQVLRAISGVATPDAAGFVDISFRLYEHEAHRLVQAAQTSPAEVCCFPCSSPWKGLYYSFCCSTVAWHVPWVPSRLTSGNPSCRRSWGCLSMVSMM